MNKLKIFVICAAVLTMCSCSDEPSIETMFEDNTLFSDYTEPDYEPENPDFSENSDIDDSPEISEIFPKYPKLSLLQKNQLPQNKSPQIRLNQRKRQLQRLRKMILYA